MNTGMTDFTFDLYDDILKTVHEAFEEAVMYKDGYIVIHFEQENICKFNYFYSKNGEVGPLIKYEYTKDESLDLIAEVIECSHFKTFNEKTRMEMEHAMAFYLFGIYNLNKLKRVFVYSENTLNFIALCESRN